MKTRNGLRILTYIALSLIFAFGALGTPPSFSVAAEINTVGEDSVVINEFNVNPATGTGKEYIELLVTKPGGVDMRGWTLSDVGGRTGTTSGTEGDVTLPSSATYLERVPQGTYVVIVLTTPSANSNTITEDTSLTDGNNKLVLIVGTTSGITTAGTFDISTSENIQLYAGSRAAGEAIDQVLAGTNTSKLGEIAWGQNISSTPTNSTARFIPSENSLASFQDNDTGSKFTVASSTPSDTPGSKNTGVSEDSAVTNPSYTDGAIPAGSYTGLTIAGNVTMGGAIKVYNNGLTIANGGTLSINETLNVEGSFINNGSLKQTLAVSSGSTTEFLKITNQAGDTIKYQGLEINPSGNMGDVTVTIKGNQTSCTTNPSDPLLTRCFKIDVTTVQPATIKFYYTEAERNGQTANALKLWHYEGSATWTQVGTNYTYSESGESCTQAFCWFQADNVSTYSPFGCGSGNAPTAIRLRYLRAASGSLVGLALSGALIGLALLRRRK